MQQKEYLPTDEVEINYEENRIALLSVSHKSETAITPPAAENWDETSFESTRRFED